MQIKFKKDLTRNNILESVEERLVYEFYLKEALVEGKRYNSPYRKDKNPSLTFKYFPNTNSWVWRDWGDGTQSKPYSIFDFVAKIYNCGFYDSLIHINNDLNLGLSSPSSPSNGTKNFSGYDIPKGTRIKKKKRLRVEFRKFENKDYKYWNSYGITKDTLIKYKVKAVSKAWVDDLLVKRDGKLTRIYAYIINGRIKISHPKSNIRFLGDVTKDDWSGYEQLPDSGENLIITKSHKDVMVLNEMGYNAISPQNESPYINNDLFSELNLRFKNIYLLFDNDEPGIEASDKFVEENKGVKQIFIDKNLTKDISDLSKKIGVKNAKTIIEELL